MSKRKIAVITGSRAEYGSLYWIIKETHEDPFLELQLIVTGMHLLSKFGSTVKDIEKDGFPIAKKVKMPLYRDTPDATVRAMGLGMIGFAKAYKALKPDIIVVLGDRFEIYSAVAAALPFRIPVAHIHGGESTEGAFDEQFRHAITKMSHIHFVSAEKYKRRIIQMGEDPKNVFCFGAPGLDNILRLDLLSNQELRQALRIPEKKKIGIVTYHPATLERSSPLSQITEVLSAIKAQVEEAFWIFTAANADTGGNIINKKIEKFVKRYPDRSKLYTSLGQMMYLSLLKHASVMVGNSSSGLAEAPSFSLPVVNIGDRQKGRIKAANVIDVRVCKKDTILDAVARATSQRFVRNLKGLKNPLGKGKASRKIVNTLKRIRLDDKLIKKSFHELKSTCY